MTEPIEPSPREIAERVRAAMADVHDVRVLLHLKPGQPLAVPVHTLRDRAERLAKEADSHRSVIEQALGELGQGADAHLPRGIADLRAALSLAERKVTDRASERSAMWDVLLAVREASGAGENDDLRAVVASLRAEAALALPSRQSGLPQPAVTVTPDGRVKVEIRHTNDLALEYLYDRPEAARLVHDLSSAVARLTPGGPRLGVNADPGEGATLGICVEIAGEVLHLSPALRMEGPQLEALVRELTAALPPVKHAGEHLEPLLAPLRPAGVLGRGELTEATPARVIQLVLERVRADKREIERLRAANAEHVARLASGTSGAGKRKRIAALEAQVEDLRRQLRQAEQQHEPQRRTITQWGEAAAEVIGRAEGLGLRMSTGATPSILRAAGQDLAAKAARVKGLEDLLASERVKTLEARREFAELRDAARTMLPEGSTPNPATSWLADVIRGAAKRADSLAAAAGAASARGDAAEAKLGDVYLALGGPRPGVTPYALVQELAARARDAEAKVARLTQPPATINLPPALRPALDAVQDIVTGVEATPEGLGAGVIKLVAELRKARRGWGEESGAAARARTELRRLQDDRSATVLPPSALSWKGVRVYPAPDAASRWLTARGLRPADLAAAEVPPGSIQAAQWDDGGDRVKLALHLGADGPGLWVEVSRRELAYHAGPHADVTVVAEKSAIGEAGELRGKVERLTAELSKRADPEAVRVIVAQAGAARQLADEIHAWDAWADAQLGTYPVGARHRRDALAERLAKAIADRDTSRQAAELAGEAAEQWAAEVERLRVKHKALRDAVSDLA